MPGAVEQPVALWRLAPQRGDPIHALAAVAEGELHRSVDGIGGRFDTRPLRRIRLGWHRGCP
jgi:hypothetical protein